MTSNSILSFNMLKSLTLLKLVELQNNLGLNKGTQTKSINTIKQICVDHYNTRQQKIIAEGILDVMHDGFGFLRLSYNSYLPNNDDIYVSPTFIKRNLLHTGDSLSAYLKVAGADRISYLSVEKIITINNLSAEDYKPVERFDNLTPMYPKRHIKLEMEAGGTQNNMIGRLIDIIAPVGAGQRGLIVSPPKSGKTTVLRYVAKTIRDQHPDSHLIILLIGERPEEVTEFRDLFDTPDKNVEIIASTFDDNSIKQIQIAEITIERAKSMVENNKDVVILLDSLTRLVRAYNEVTPSSGRVMSGGIEAQALHAPKRLFGAARQTKEAGSLTILASVLVETGSKMDEVIFEEFKGTGNMELYLSRKLAERCIFPAIHFQRSGTRREDLILSYEVCNKLSILRRLLSDMNELESIEFLISKLQVYKSNLDFFNIMNKQL
jgi:transcription termination factor Rho